LAAFDGRLLKLSGLRTLDAATATALARSKAWSGEVWQMDTLSADAVRPLAERAGDRAAALRVRGLTRLDAETSQVLASSPAWDGMLPNLRSLDAATARVLVACRAPGLSLSGLRTLDAETAAVLAGSQRWNGELYGMTALDGADSLAVAKALATHKGPLSLLNLKKISPKTLSALITKEDVELPLIETLELIPEPDGSATDDFVIPKAFQERQKRR